MKIDRIILKNEFYLQKIILFENGNPKEINIHEEREFHEGFVCLGKIKKKINLPNDNYGFFVDIGDYKDAFLPGFEKAIDNNNLTEGQSVIVEIVQEARDDKGAKLKRALNIASENLVYSPFKMGVIVSSKIKDEDKLLAGELHDLVFDNIENQEGWVVRTSAKNIDKEQILIEMKSLREIYENIYSQKDDKAPKCLYKPAHPVVSYMIKYQNSLSDIIISDARLFNEINEYNLKHNIVSQDVIKSVNEDELNNVCDVEEIIFDALKREVLLKSGGRLYIEQTKAFTAIDVDSGDSNGFSVSAVNNEAAKEILNQVRLRNIAGKVIIDFAGSKEYKFMKKPLDILTQEAKTDFSKSWVAGLTKSGNVELVRTRKRPSIYDELEAKCPSCFGLGKVKNQKMICFELCQKIYNQVICENATEAKISVNREVYNSLNTRFSYLFDLLKKKIGFNPKLVEDNNFSIDEYDIEVS